MLEDVVVTGYQTIAREKVTGSVATLTAKDLSDRYTPNLLDNLEGRVAGLTIYNDKAIIRGTSSLYAENSPLLVIDGLPVEAKLSDLNPYDIASINVLKDAAAAAIYGARASNGVIVVATRKAPESGRVNVDVSADFTVYQKRNLDYARNFRMTPEQQINVEKEYYEYYFFNNDGEVLNPIGDTESAINRGNSMSPIWYAYYQLAKGEITRAELEGQLNALSKNNFAKEYADNALRNRFLQQYNVAVRTRSDKYQSSLVVNYKHDNVGIIQAGDDMISFFYKGTYEVAPWLTANFSANSMIGNSRSSNSQFATDPFNMPAYYSLLNDDGSYNYYAIASFNQYNTQADDDPALRPMHVNHLEELYYDQKKTSRRDSRYHGELLFNVIPGLTVNTQFVYETNRQKVSSYAEAESYIMRAMRNAYTVQAGTSVRYMIPENGGKLATTDTQGEHWTGRGQLNFSRDFEKQGVNLIAGLEFRQTQSKGTRGLLLGYDDQLQSHATTSVNFSELNNYTYTTYFIPGHSARQYYYTPYIERAIGPIIDELHRYASGYVNATYTYDSRYNAFGSFRKDYADVYGLNAKFRGKPLWSVGASWNIHHETFVKDLDGINTLQLRASYGATGNIYQEATSHMTANSSLFNEVTQLPMSRIESPGNPELKWEQTRTTNIGIDFTLFERLRGTFDWYHKKGLDLFSNKTLDPSKGFTSLVMNVAGMKNNGVEWMLSYDWFRGQGRDDFSWNTSMTGSYNKNKITYVEIQATQAGELVYMGFQPGYPVSALFSFQFAGIDDKGNPTWYGSGKDENGVYEVLRSAQSTGIEALVYSGQTEPKVVVGIENQFHYKGFRLGMMMAYYGGHKMRVLQAIPISGVPFSTIPSYFLNAWTPDNTDTNVPGIGRYSVPPLGVETTYSDIYVQPADFLKIRNIVLGYDLPVSLLSKVGLSRATLRFQVDNPKYLWVKNKVGIDPETLSTRRPTSFIFGFNINI
jgi:TonB-linked SusC/RagA family outer membrane protein